MTVPPLPTHSATRRSGVPHNHRLGVKAHNPGRHGQRGSGGLAALQARDRSANKFDLGKLESSQNVALKQYGGGTKTLPGYLVLYNNIDVHRNPQNYGLSASDQLDAKRSGDALRKMFGTRFLTNASSSTTGNVGVNWDGSGNYGNPTNNTLGPKTILEGHQCLVFYLGGVATFPNGTTNPPKMNGFSANPVDPLDFVTTNERIGPFYEFENNRLVTATQYGLPNTMLGTNYSIAKYPAYQDRYGTPFAYFGGTGGSNSYVTGTYGVNGTVSSATNPLVPLGCRSIGISIPYPDSAAGKFMRPDSYQILSAGKNKVFGDPSLWNPSAGSTDGNARDDVSNFSGYALTSPVS
jgi:hypothetical protein